MGILMQNHKCKEVEIALPIFNVSRNKNTQYNAYLWPNRRKSRVSKEIGVEEHDGDVRF